MTQDIRYAARQLRSNPVFTLAAVITLALGIGANTAIFTVVESVLLAPLPYKDASRIVAIDTRWTNRGQISHRVTGPDAVDLRSQAKSLEFVSTYSEGNIGVQLRDHAAFTVVTFTDANFARVFNLAPVAGRAFTNAEAHRAALVSEGFAREQFGSAEAAVGKTLDVENQPLEITGVLSQAFNFPAKTQVWAAVPLQPESMERTAFNYRAIGKLRAGVSRQAASAELDTISRRLESAYPDANRYKRMTIVPLQEELTGKVRPMLVLLLSAVGIVLLIACVNVTHLELARSLARQRELAVRTALGSSRWQLGRLLIAESLLVSLAGGTLGVWLAIPAVKVLVALAPEGLPRAAEIHLNGWVLAFTLGLALLTTLVSSLVPARRAAKVDPAQALKQDSSRGMAGHAASSMRNALVVGEVAATFVLAVCAGLLLRTLVTLTERNLGYQTARMLLVDSDAPAHSKNDALRVVREFDDLFSRLAMLPGVEGVGGVMGLPTGDYGSNGYYKVSGATYRDMNHEPYADFSVASPGYFGALGIPLQRGRDFSAQDTYDGNFVAVISQSLAKQSFGSADPLGRQLQCGLDSNKWMTVIGVVGDVRQDSPASNPGPTLYMPMAQHPFYATQIDIVLRTKIAPLTLMHVVQKKIKEINPAIATRYTTMDAMVGKSMAAERFRSVLLSSFAGLGLLLAMVGVYGTMAYSVAQRTFEIGVRMACGAERSAIRQMMLWQAGKLACWGILIGLAVSVALSRLIAGMLVGVPATDPATLATACGLLLLIGLIAAWWPARRAASTEPIEALRAE
ncbi:MAG TPA: ABC transporter permease [Silvibacterium sp.]|nr:ABC transporter permease [Silvibacterium sp.]